MKFITLTTLALGLILLAGDSMAQGETPAGSFYQWTNEEGVVSFTDDVKRIPSRYVDRATLRTWEEVHASVEKRFTPESTTRPPHVWAEAVLEPNPNRERNCTGHITVKQTRVREGAYNRQMFVVRDECGKVTSVTQQRPHIHINR